MLPAYDFRALIEEQRPSPPVQVDGFAPYVGYTGDLAVGGTVGPMVTDGVTHSQLDTSVAGARAAYEADYQDRLAQLTKRLRELRMPLLPLQTHQDPLKQLLTVFPPR